MKTTQKLARFGATLALALTLVAATAPTFAFADDGDNGDQSSAPFVLNTVDASIQEGAGASEFGLDCLFVTAGIHAEELGGRDNPDVATLGKVFAAAGLYPKAVMRQLEW